MKLRKLEEKDAPAMMEWMQDPNINCFFRFDADSVTADSVLRFIADAQQDTVNRHYAVDSDGAYMGTISLKNIDEVNRNAEYAISMCSYAMGTGLAREATVELLRIAFEDLKLHKVYLNVYAENIRAIKFYKKIGFAYEGTAKDQVLVKGRYRDLCWYGIVNTEG